MCKIVVSDVPASGTPSGSQSTLNSGQIAVQTANLSLCPGLLLLIASPRSTQGTRLSPHTEGMAASSVCVHWGALCCSSLCVPWQLLLHQQIPVPAYHPAQRHAPALSPQQSGLLGMRLRHALQR